MRVGTLTLLLLLPFCAFCQEKQDAIPYINNVSTGLSTTVNLPPVQFYKNDSLKIPRTDTIPAAAKSSGFIIREVCKGYRRGRLELPVVLTTLETAPAKKESIPIEPKKRVPLLKVTGNILYDVNYRSRIDTPYAENNIYQHTLQTRLNFVYKDQYPFRVYLTTRFSNSSLFRKYTDLNFQYIQSDFTRLMKNTVLEAVNSFLASKASRLDSLRKVIDARRAAIASLHHSVERPDISQKLVEERERNMLAANKPAPGNTASITDLQKQLDFQEKYKFPAASKSDTGSATNNSSSKKLQEYYGYRDSIEASKRKLDTLIDELAQLEKLYGNLKSVQQFNQHEWGKEIEEAKDANTLTDKLHQLNMPDTLLPKGYKTLYALQSFSIGRSMANYTELTVKNISITGLQVEYNPHYYYAFAAGKVDYRFRDYIIPNQPNSNQYVALVRFGKGTKNGNHIIFTYYTGRRQFFNASIVSQPNNPVPEYNLAGISIEGLYKIGKTTSLVAEVAKSTVPYYSLDSLQKKNWMNSVTQFSDRSNEAYSLRLNSYLPKTQTRLTGSIRYIGANFQSFSTFTTGAAQTKWLARVEQPFFKKQLNIVSELQQNDYNNPFVTTAYKSSSLLASLQATLRIKKWPVLSVGYYPSYQLTKTGDNEYSENRYYTFISNASYYYQVHTVQFSSYIVYSQFYNQASDSGFVYFNSKNWLISQNITVNRLSMLFNWSESVNTGYNITTIENNDQFAISRIIAVGGGLKMIRHTLFDKTQWGYSGNLTFKIPKLGDIQLMMDKGFIPALNKQLVENKMGRLTYFKTF